MACFHPRTGYRSREVGPSGKRRIVFDAKLGFADLPVTIPCGQCIGCRLERSRQWAIRCSHEASLWQDNCFITLTFSNEHLPENLSLDVRDYQLFMKRLRKKYGQNIRFYHCGEYGEKYKRPHYHACLFNFDFPDKRLFKELNGNKLYTSNSLQELWPFGYSTIGDVTFQSAAYVARYIMKKITGEEAALHYERVHPETGEIFQVKPEYTTMSRRPGIGSGWFERYRTDVYPDDFVVINGVKMRPPKFYDSQYEALDEMSFKRIKRKRKTTAKKHADNNTPDRLAVRKQVQEARLRLLPRNLDGED